MGPFEGGFENVEVFSDLVTSGHRALGLRAVRLCGASFEAGFEQRVGNGEDGHHDCGSSDEQDADGGLNLCQSAGFGIRRAEPQSGGKE